MDQVLPPARDGLLADVVARIEGDRSAFHLIERAADGLLWRLALIDSATESLDVQYFIWKGDESGILVFSRIVEAAHRGVQVRLLIDDLNLAARDEELAALARHTNIAFKVWNPSRTRSTAGTLGEYAASFDEMNKRMHNKIVLADGHAGLTGGRNVANEYFGLADKYNFLDLDVLAFGPVVIGMGAAFDDYWNSDLSVPIGEIAEGEEPLDLNEFIAGDHATIDAASELLARFPLRRKDWSDEFEYLPERWHLGTAFWLQDEPVTAGFEKSRLLDMIDLTAAPVEEELYAVSAYLLPVGDLLSNIAELVDDGITVKIVTGTMESVNHTAAYAHYRNDIGAIIDTGAELYEVHAHPMALVREAADTPPVDSRFMAIHLKGLVADRKKAFVGSLNLDPRALVINTEGGLYIESEGLAGALADWFDIVIGPGNAWRVERDDETGNLTWTSGDQVREKSPDRGPVQRFAADFFETLPIKSQL